MKHFDDTEFPERAMKDADDSRDLLAPGFSMVAAARLAVLSCVAILWYLFCLSVFK